MKLFMAVTGLIMLLVSASCHAITLKLDPEIDLLVLDGRKISGSLLKGADSLEKSRGPPVLPACRTHHLTTTRIISRYR